MTSDKFLTQEEIDLLTSAQPTDGVTTSEAQPVTPAIPEDEVISAVEKDALGEVGNISMGSASTTLSELLGQKVNITSPRVSVTNKKELLDNFHVPYLVIKVEFVEGLYGFNVLVMKVRDARVIANLMMGGDGHPEDETAELNEMDVSAASEAMNMMIGSASTSLAQMFGMPVNISPPQSTVLQDAAGVKPDDVLPEVGATDNLVVVSFNMTIGDLVDTDIMQVLSVDTAKTEAALLLQGLEDMMNGTDPAPDPIPEAPQDAGDDIMDQSEIENLLNAMMGEQPPAEEVTATPPPAPVQQPQQQQPQYQQSPAPAMPAPRNLDLILDIPLTVSVVLGRTKKPIKDVLSIGPGAVVELHSLADEPVEILVNGTLVAEGEVVVVNENFGVKITNIISPADRIKRLAQ